MPRLLKRTKQHRRYRVAAPADVADVCRRRGLAYFRRFWNESSVKKAVFTSN